MSEKLEIPEWTGSTLTIGAFTNYASSVLGVFMRKTFAELSLDELGPDLVQAVRRLTDFINRQRAFDETPEVVKADANRDALFKALWYGWHYAMELDPEHALHQAAAKLMSEMNAYKGVWKHEISKETTELKGLQRDLSSSDNVLALQTLGLKTFADALFAANDAVAAAIDLREQERGERIAEKGGDTTASLRKTVVTLLVDCYRQVNAADRIIKAPATAAAIQDVCGVIEHYKHIAAQPASRQNPEPAPDAPDGAGGGSASGGEASAS